MSNKGKKKFQIEICETLSKVVVVMATDIEEAREKVDTQYSEGNHVLDYNNHVDTSIRPL
jgi:hypothetical protein